MVSSVNLIMLLCGSTLTLTISKSNKTISNLFFLILLKIMFQVSEQNSLSSKGNSTLRSSAGNQNYEFLPTATVTNLVPLKISVITCM